MSDKPMDRRRFFRRGLQELIKPLADAIAPLEQVANQLGSMEAKLSKPAPPSQKPTIKLQSPPAWLRPPGALDEAAFASTCIKSGECVNVCPARCISIDTTGKKGNGLPVIDVNHMPCVVCDGLYCMHACPSGALVPTALADIDMGTAKWREMTCVRSQGEDCTICVDRCPLGSAAIELLEGKIHVIEDGCIGCGVCEHACPTSPKSIVVIPKAAKV